MSEEHGDAHATPVVDDGLFHQTLVAEAIAITSGETDLIANTANVASVIHEHMNVRKKNSVNWTGFYFMRKGGLVLGPFQGKSACVRIAVGRGVCGTAVKSKETQFVPDVHLFPGHIACDTGSNSEVVVPIIVNGEVKGVLDLDCLLLNGFDQDDKKALEAIIRHCEAKLDWSQL